MLDYFPRVSGKDHVLVNITMSVMIGVDFEEDDTPRAFCDMVRETVKTTGAIILTSSIVATKRLNFVGSSREKIVIELEKDKYRPPHIEEG